MIILESKLAEVLGRPLKSGAHNPDSLMCVMEAVAYVAGEPWSDHPKCACPVLSAFMRSWNDALPSDAERDRLLKPLISELVDSKSTQGVEERRSYLALDWLVRVFTPKFLDLVPSLASHAKALRDLEEIADITGAVAAGKLTIAAGAAAWTAAGDAAWTAAGDAAARDAGGDAAARAAAGDAAAWAAAGAAAGDAARDAAGDAAARDAARAAAGDAARDAGGAAAGAAGGAAAGDAAARAAAETAAWAAAGAAAGDAAGAAAWTAARAAAGDAAARAAAGDAAAWAAAWTAARAAAARAAARAALQPTVEWLQLSALNLVDRMLAVQPVVAMGVSS